MSVRHFKIFVAIEALISAFAEWTKLGAFRAIRRTVLDQPKATIALRKRGIIAYAVFCGTAPYLLGASLIWFADSTNLLPPDPLQRAYSEIREWENEISEIRGESRVECENMAALSLSAGRRCFTTTSRMLEGLQAETTTLYRELRVFESVKAASISSILGACIILANALVFSIMWLRVHPMHRHRSDDDLAKTWRAYLLIMATTVFIPNCIGALIGFSVDIMTRLEPWTAAGLSGSVLVAGSLPFAVCGILGCYRLNQVLLNSSTWRVGHTWWILVSSNAITMILGGAILLFFFIVVFIPLFL